MVKVSPLTDPEKDKFTALFGDYYKELGCADDTVHLVDEYIIPDLLAGLLKIDMLHDGSGCNGFIIYQIDDIDNDWNFKEGWGDVREIYVTPDARGQGLGKLLLYTAEMRLRESGADKAYCLPFESARPFFTACGYAETDGYNQDLDCAVFEKLDLNNRCK